MRYLSSLAALLLATALPAQRPPNVIVVLADDLGYGDLSAHGSPTVRTPHIDRLIAEGVRCTDAYAFPTCSPSRAALLTGQVPPRVGIPKVVGPPGPQWTADRQYGLHPDSTVTIAEVLRDAGYATGIIGKWHLGHFPETGPLRHGFDEYYGLPYSSDMLPPDYPDLPVLRGATVAQRNPDLDTLTASYHREALAFLERHRERPFFLYLAHHLPHVPLAGSKAFAKTRNDAIDNGARTRYAQIVAEIDDGIGRLSAKLDTLGLAENTVVIFTSDNGPWLVFGNHAGSAGPFREGKATSFEGGVRVPMVWRWPGVLPKGAAYEGVTGLLDVLPTLAGWAGANVPEGLDGGDIGEGLRTGAAPIERPHYYWREGRLEAVREGRWKLYLPHGYNAVAMPGRDGTHGTFRPDSIGRVLYDLLADPGERFDVLSEHPEVAARLTVLAKAHQADVAARHVSAWAEE